MNPAYAPADDMVFVPSLGNGKEGTDGEAVFFRVAPAFASAFNSSVTLGANGYMASQVTIGTEGDPAPPLREGILTVGGVLATIGQMEANGVTRAR